MQSINTTPWVPGLPFGAFSFRKDSSAFAQPTPALVGLTEFYITSTGANINAGSGTGAALYTSVTGSWSTVTNIFTPTDNVNPVASGVQVGMFASIYADGATTAVYITRITQVVNAVNGAITVSSTVIYGTAPVTAATTSITVGGAWIGPSGAVTFPFGLTGAIGVLKDANSNQVRLNVRNDQTYTMTAALPFTTLGNATMQGYTNLPGDLGKSTFTTNLNSASNFTSAGVNGAFIDLIFVCTAVANSNHLFQTTSNNDLVFIRCVFHGARNNGYVYSGTGGNTYLIECECYDCNKANSAARGGFVSAGTGGSVFCYSCYSHDHAAGTNAHGYTTNSTSGMTLINCIADTCAGNGAFTVANAQSIICINCNFYNNGVDGVRFTAAVLSFAVLINNNFLKNGGSGINATVATQSGILYNNGRGLGSQQNALGDSLKSIVNAGSDVFYAADTSPWNAPITGDFTTIVGSAAVGAGRGHFEETDGTNSGTLSYPVIGVSTATVPAAKGGLRLAGHGGLAA